MAFLQHSSTCRIRSMPHCDFSAGSVIRKGLLSPVPRRTFLWWWMKRGTNDWTPSVDDSFQRHIMRKEKMLRYKYSKAIRRRQLWDRDPSHNFLRPTWGWQIPGLSSTNDGQALSSKSSPPASSPSQKPSGREAIDDFAQVKACIDSDPFAAVFGRRLIAHQKPNDASWSSFSWMFHSTPPKDGQNVPQKPALSNTPPTSKPSSISSSNRGLASRPSESSSDSKRSQEASIPKPPRMAANCVVQADDYEFDPISMRKVLKSRAKSDTSADASKPLFDPLFAEKGVDVPVKPYKSHRVFGYSGKSSSIRTNAKSSPSKGVQAKAEPSRVAELRNLKATALGNSIDTTAQYHGEWIPEAQEAKQKSNPEPTVGAAAIEAPLFSGNTYEAKSNEILKGTNHLKQDWLNREGFGTKQDSSIRAACDGDSPKAENGRDQSPARFQPALDRFSSTGQASDKLEPSLNRLVASSKNTIPSNSREKPIIASCMAQESTSEDLDLLRASDIRASSRSSRQSKQGGEKTKREKRDKLEQDFESHLRDDDGLSVVFPNSILASSKKLSESVYSMWHRARAKRMTWLGHKAQALSGNGDSVVKNTIKSMECKNQETPESEVNGVSNVYKTSASPIQTFTPSQEVLDAEKESKARTLALRSATLEKVKLEAKVRETEKALAQNLKAAYEDEYGPITITHRQGKDTVRLNQLAKETNEVNARAEDSNVRDKIALYEDALKTQRGARLEKLKANDARLESSSAPGPPRCTSMPTGSQSTESAIEEKPTVEPVIGKAAVEAKQESSSPKAPPSTIPSVYKVLAHGPWSSEIKIAETTSSVSALGDTEAQTLHPAEVLSRLDNVAYFLPHFADMEKQGYEIVSGGGNVLVFKKTRSPAEHADNTTKSSDAIAEGSSKPCTPSSRPASPGESVIKSLAPDASSSTVRRQEDVFSGSGQTWHQQEGGSDSSSSGSSSSNPGSEPRWFRKMVKRVFLTGALTAAIAYIIGVIAEQAGAQQQKGRPRRWGRPGIYSTEDSR
jgi:hypothetical protein